MNPFLTLLNKISPKQMVPFLHSPRRRHHQEEGEAEQTEMTKVDNDNDNDPVSSSLVFKDTDHVRASLVLFEDVGVLPKEDDDDEEEDKLTASKTKQDPAETIKKQIPSSAAASSSKETVSYFQRPTTTAIDGDSDYDIVEDENEAMIAMTCAIVKEQEQLRQDPPGGKSRLKKSLVQTFDAQEEDTVIKVLKEIDAIGDKYYKRGFNEWNFTAGVMNCLLVAYVFGRFPQHFWIVYLLESCWFIPYKFYNMITAKPLNEVLYYFDFCWMMNFNALVILMALLVEPFGSFWGSATTDKSDFVLLSDDFRRAAYAGLFGIACGPLLGAALLLPFVAFVFHDVNTMANVVIHAMPPMLFYIFHWHADEIHQAWPNVFVLRNVQETVTFFPSLHGGYNVAGYAIFIYLSWFIPYTSWMLLMGMDLPRKNRAQTPVFDTVFHSFWRTGFCQTFGTLLWKRPIETSRQQILSDDYEVRDFLVYMAIHLVLVLLSIPTLAWACHSSKELHMGIMLVILLAVVHRGSQRYTYYTTKMYSRILRKEFLTTSKGQ